MRKLEVQKFIRENPDWETVLSKAPYCINAIRAEWNGRNLLMLKYDQNETDWANAGVMARECRGIIFDENTMEPVSVPFFKFFNGHEPYADAIDWNDKPYVLEKVDGSLIKVVKLDGRLLVSTNGTPLASDAGIPDCVGCGMRTFEDLFYWALDRQFTGFERGWFENLLSEGYTYMFELCTDYNRVVVPHPEPAVYFIGVRDNSTLEEIYIFNHPMARIFPTPKIYQFGTFDECIETAKALPWDSEGYVVTGRDFRRVKEKSPAYLSVAHLCNNHVMSHSRAIELVRINEVDEVLAYFPEFKDALLDVRDRYAAKVAELGAALEKMRDFIASNGWDTASVVAGGENRKALAGWVMANFPIPGLAFAVVDGRVESVRAWLDAIPAYKMARTLGFRAQEE